MCHVGYNHANANDPLPCSRSSAARSSCITPVHVCVARVPQVDGRATVTGHGPLAPASRGRVAHLADDDRGPARSTLVRGHAGVRAAREANFDVAGSVLACARAAWRRA